MRSVAETRASHFEGLSPEQQSRLSVLLDDYFAGLEQGRPPSRSQLVARAPDLAGPLATYLESIEFLHAAGAGSRAAGEPIELPEAGRRGQTQLGDFSIVREIGRGGMGVVYEARQVSLNRRVALKILPSAALLDPKRIARFRNEAQAAAQLSHPHIVPVYSIGTDRGVHYYAMRFIDGQPLDRAIEGLRCAAGIIGESPTAYDETVDYEDKSGSAHHENRDVSQKPRSSDSKSGLSNGQLAVVPSETPACRKANTTDGALIAEYSKANGSYFRTIARLGIQAAKALHAAHEIGIVHRDIKPSNLLLDAEGTLWVTDFGVARCLSDADITKTGELLGTMRYMSPELASGQLHLVDHRTDIYQLGVTLYELLALRHPVQAEEPTAILRHLESEQPCRLRRWNPAIPTDLENIVHKSMCKSRDDRYATAQDLADDLRRFLEGKPTLAKRPTAVERAAKWVRRHKVVASFVAVLMLAVLALLTSTTMLAYQKRVTRQALASAQENFHQYRAQLALTNNHLALLQEQNGNSQQAEAFFEEAIRLQRQIIEDQPDDEATLRELAATLSNFSVFCAEHDLPQAAACYEKTLSVQQGLVDADPANVEYRSDLALTYSNFGSFQAKHNRPAHAVRAYCRAIAILSQLRKDTAGAGCERDLAVSYNNLGMIQDALGELPDAEQSFRNALEALESSAQTSNPTPMDFSSRGGVYNNLGMVLESQGRRQDAASAYLHAIEYQKTARDLAPQVGRFRDLLSKHYGNHSRMLHKLRDG